MALPPQRGNLESPSLRSIPEILVTIDNIYYFLVLTENFKYAPEKRRFFFLREKKKKCAKTEDMHPMIFVANLEKNNLRLKKNLFKRRKKKRCKQYSLAVPSVERKCATKREVHQVCERFEQS